MGLKVCMHGVEMGPSKENVIAGGVPNSVIRLAKALNNSGMKPILVTNDRKFREIGEKTNGFTLPWADVHFIFISGKYANIKYLVKYLIKTIQKVKKITENEKLDIIHGHSGHLGLAIVTAAVSRFTGIPAVHTIYCPINTKSNMCLFYKFFLKDVKRIIAISENVKQSLNEIGISSNKIAVIPPIVDFSIFNPNVDGENIRDVFGIGDEFAILFLGNLTKTKGIDTVLDALNMVKKQYPNFRLLSGIELTHSGTDIRKNEILNKIKAYNLTQNIIELGLIKNVENFMAAADVVVAPFQDTYGVADYPLVVMESMAVGTLVITTRVGGIPEIVNNEGNGILIDPNNPLALFHEIIKLIENPEERRKIGKISACFVKRKFPEKEIIETTKQVYEKVLYE